MTPAFIVRPACWQADEAAIARVRRAVFIEEQHVPEAMEWEDLDPACLWFAAFAPGEGMVGVGRLAPDGRIGRMAVLPDWRGRGVGSAVLGEIVNAARARGQGSVTLSAQVRAVPFYAGHGFIARGPEYLDAGIPHVTMTLELGTSS